MYTEDPMHALPHRRRILSETRAYIAQLREACDERRAAAVGDFSSPSAYAHSMCPKREQLRRMLGRPLCESPAETPTTAEIEWVAEDEYGRMERLHVECAPGLFSYGLLFTPNTAEKTPLVTALHGGWGTSEVISSFYDSANYHDLVQKVRARGPVTVYVPQLILWRDLYDETPEDAAVHLEFDRQLKQCGGSIAALELFKVQRSVDWILANRPVDAEHMGVLGLSYGGFYTLFSAATDPRYRVALSSCFFNDRYRYDWDDWVFFDAASQFLDPDVAALVCPRALCIQVGERDPLFDAAGARRLSAQVAETYEKLGISEKFRFAVHPGEHEFFDVDLDFFFSHL